MLAAVALIDWIIVGLYGVAVVAIAWRAQRKQKSSEDYLMGGRRLPWWIVGVSIIATNKPLLAHKALYGS